MNIFKNEEKMSIGVNLFNINSFLILFYFIYNLFSTNKMLIMPLIIFEGIIILLAFIAFYKYIKSINPDMKNMKDMDNKLDQKLEELDNNLEEESIYIKVKNLLLSFLIEYFYIFIFCKKISIVLSIAIIFVFINFIIETIKNK